MLISTVVKLSITSIIDQHGCNVSLHNGVLFLEILCEKQQGFGNSACMILYVVGHIISPW